MSDRDDTIAGLRELADLLAANPKIPVSPGRRVQLSIRTLGDHRRYSREQVESLVRGIATPPQRQNAEATT